VKLTEKQWSGYKGKYKKHNVEINLSERNNSKWKFKLYKDGSHLYDSEWHGNKTFFDTKEEASEAAKAKIDELVSVK